MQFIKNGPDVPEKLLQAHADGRVVFFCGAGISYPAGLPGFGGLVTAMARRLGVGGDRIFAAAMKASQFDTAVARLEADVVGGRPRVRGALAAELVPDLSRRGATATHEALLTLARDDAGRVKLITTNFDALFDEADRRLGRRTPAYLAPLLPVPKKRWDGLVYLHGKLSEQPTASELDRLVVSSGDFGLAYLTERWAARFVSELFRNHVVCFVGYSLADPVMRYMTDALAADRQLGEAPIDVFAFGGFKGSAERAETDGWRAKNVTPILYRVRGRNHAMLHDTLQAWADTWRDGVRGKEAIVARYAGLAPGGSTRQDDFVGRMLWALSDSRGLPARAFAEHDPLPVLDWLEQFERARFGHGDLARFGVEPDREADARLSFGLTARPAPYSLGPRMRLVGGHGASGPRWDKVMAALGLWLARHLDDPMLLVWVAERGGRPEPGFADRIRSALGSRPPPKIIKTLWEMVLAGLVVGPNQDTDAYGWLERLNAEGSMTAYARTELRALLSPRVRLRKSYVVPRQQEDDEDEEGANLPASIECEIVLSADHAHSFWQIFGESSVFKAALPELVDMAEMLLEEAMALSDLLGLFFVRQSAWARPSISAHAQNGDFSEWTVLVELVRDAWSALAQSDPLRASSTAERWARSDFPIFKRLFLHAVAEAPTLFPVSRPVDFLLGGEGEWLWDSDTQREVMVLFHAIARTLPEGETGRLQRAILAGPEDRSPDDPERSKRRSDRPMWGRLSGLIEAGAEPIPDAARWLADMSSAHPDFKPATERYEFGVWFGDAGDWRRFENTPTEPDQLADWLDAHPDEPDFNMHDDWHERCRTDPSTTMAVLIRLASRRSWPIGRWREALQAWSDKEIVAATWSGLGTTMLSAPADFIGALDHALAWWLREVVDGIPALAEADVLPLMDRMIDPIADKLDVPEPGETDSGFKAINHPAGILARTALVLWYRGGLDDDQGISGPLGHLFERLCDPHAPGLWAARAALARETISLYRVDRAWTGHHLLPFFDWKAATGEARTVWTGFLWSGRFHPGLFEAIAPEFLATARHYEELGRAGSSYAGLLAFAGLEGKPFTRPQLATATATLPEAGRLRVLSVLEDGLLAAGDRRAENWRNRVLPFWHGVWPKSLAFRTEATAVGVARLAIAAGEAFPEAMAVLRDWLIPIERPDATLRHLSQTTLPSDFPRESLDLLDRVIGTGSSGGERRASLELAAISKAWPAAADDPRFVRLAQRSRMGGFEPPMHG